MGYKCISKDAKICWCPLFALHCVRETLGDPGGSKDSLLSVYQELTTGRQKQQLLLLKTRFLIGVAGVRACR